MEQSEAEKRFDISMNLLDDAITSIRNRYSNNPYSTTCSCDKNIA